MNQYKMAQKIIIVESKPTKKHPKKRFYVVVKSRNGRILSTSELLNSKQAAMVNILACRSTFSAVRLNEIPVIKK